VEGVDIHTETALLAFRLPREAVNWPEFKQKYRLPAKTVGFGILYGQTPAGAQENIIAQGGPYIPIEEVEEIIRNWFLVYEGVARWMQQQYARVRRYGMAWDAFGRSRVIPEGRSVIPRVQSAGLRQAGNMPVQATAGGILKLAMAELQDALLDWRRAYPSEILLPLLQIHDELVFELSESLADDWCEYAKGVMTQAVRLTIPVGASASVGDCWGELK
jgi:DNA polymerase-1